MTASSSGKEQAKIGAKGGMRHDEILDALRLNSVFGSIDPVALDLLAGIAEVRMFKKGATIVVEGEPGAHAYVIINGAVKIYLRSPDGEIIELLRRHNGQMFGEVALLDGGPRTASVDAVMQTSVLAIERQLFIGVLKREPRAVDGLLSWLGAMIRERARLGIELGFLDIRQRVARRILALIEMSPDGELTRHHRITQKELAEMVGASRQTVNGALQSLQAEGYITVDVDGIRVRKPQALSRLAT